MAEKEKNIYSWEDAKDNGFDVGEYGDTPGKLQPWSRSTVADGRYLQQKTIIPLSGRDEYLLNKINEVNDKPLDNEVYRVHNGSACYMDADTNEPVYDMVIQNITADDIITETIYGTSGEFGNESTLTGSKYIELETDITEGTTVIRLKDEVDNLSQLLDLIKNKPTDMNDYVIGCTNGNLKWVKVGYTERE